MFKIDNLLIRMFSKYVGIDEFGNRYFIAKSQDSYGIYRRRVIYKGIAEPSKIPPMWHAWLHYVVDEIPEISNYKWQKAKEPNLTGSEFAYKPINIKDPEQFNKDKIYQSWQPREEV